jgi:hypothetical protein
MFDDDFELEAERLLNTERSDRSGGVDMAAPSVRRRLSVGRADDPSERLADKMADSAVAGFRSPDPTGVRRSASADPLGGTEVDNDVQRTIDSRRGSGSALRPREAQHFSDSYGTDLSDVRVHTDATADTLSRSLQADAFTTGSDVFFRKGTYQPGTSKGDHLIGHELAHVASEGGGGAAQRSVRRFVSVDDFKSWTNLGMLASSGDHKNAVVKLLQEYDGIKKKSDVQPAMVPHYTNMLQKVNAMIDWSEDYLDENADEKGSPDKGVVKRYEGFLKFLGLAMDRKEGLEQTIDKKSSDPAKAKAPKVDASAAKLRKHTGGDETTLFTKIGLGLSQQVENDGDSTEFSIELKVPVGPGAFVGGTASVSAEKDGGNIKARCQLMLSGGGSVGVAEIKGALGGYVEAQGTDGAMVGDLLQYALYRRMAESNLVPAEVQNYIFGGDTGAKGARRAERKTLATEKKAFGDGSGDDNYAESGGIAELSAEAGLQSAKIGGSASYTEGKRTDKKSLEMKGMTAGDKKGKADTWASKLTGGARGAQESTGRTVRGFNLGFELSAPVEASVGYEARWMSEPGPAGKPGKMTMSDNKLSFEMNLTSGLAALAGDEAAGKVNDAVSKIIGQIETDMKKADAKTLEDRERIQLEADIDNMKGDITGEVENSLSEALGSSGMQDEGTDYAAEGKVYENKGSFSFGVDVDFAGKEVVFTLSEETKRTLDLGVVKVEAAKKSKKFEKKKSFAGGKK